MDEPFGALDPLTRAHLQTELLAIQRLLGVTIIMVTHDLEEAVTMADVIAVMDNGEILQLDTPENLLRHPKPGFVQNLVAGTERSLRLLSTKQVGQVMSPLVSRVAHPNALTISAKASLREAMSILMWEQAEQLTVLDHTGAPVGYIRLLDILPNGAKQ